MLADALREKMENNQTVYGPFAALVSADIVEMFALAGFDFTVIDCEHSISGPDRAVDMIRAAHSRGMPAMVRVPNALPSTILKHLDIGPDGIMVPLVHTPELARQAAEAARYYPKGKRGFAQMRGGDYGYIGVADYIKEWNEKIFVQVQAESVEAVENIKEIVAVDGIDSVFIGTFDLSQSLGVPGEIDNPKEVDCIKTVLDAILGADKIAGIFAASIESAKRYAEMGFQFVVYSDDLTMLLETTLGATKALKG